MPDEAEIEQVRSALLGLCAPLHEAFRWADVTRERKNRLLADQSLYGWYATHTVRAYAHHRLARPRTRLGAWRLTGNHARNGELWLSDGSYSARVLHSQSKTEVPPPGPKAQRRAFYRNPPLRGIVQEPLFGPLGARLLLLWRMDPASHLASFRVVRPVGDWQWGNTAQVDMDFPLPRTAVDLSAMEFVLTDDVLEMDIPSSEEGADDRGIPG
jgi:hypothetical protein